MWAVLLFALAAAAQDSASVAWENTVRLSQVENKVAAALANQPDYVCLATFDRYNRPGMNANERKLDTIRVEVAYVGGKELYSWPGENQFSEKPLSSMISNGMVGDGAFAVHAHNLFVSGGGVIRYVGQEGSLFRWDYTISQFQNSWFVSHSGQQQKVGSAGSFWADAKTLDLVRLDNNATDLASTFPLLSVSSRVDYSRVQIGTQDVLMPVRSEMKTVTAAEGAEARNVITYAGCRQYSGQSTITFGDPPPTVPAAPASRVEEVKVPGGVTMKLRLVTDISLASAHVGDPIEAILDGPMRSGNLEIAPRGAQVKGRIRYINENPAELGISFDELAFPGHSGHFSSSLIAFDSATSGVRLLLSREVQDGNVLRRTEMTPPDMPGACVFFVKNGLPKGALMTWQTVR